MTDGRHVWIEWEGKRRRRRDVINELHAAGVPVADIARRLGVRYQIVYQTVRSLGVGSAARSSGGRAPGVVACTAHRPAASAPTGSAPSSTAGAGPTGRRPIPPRSPACSPRSCASLRGGDIKTQPAPYPSRAEEPAPSALFQQGRDATSIVCAKPAIDREQGGGPSNTQIEAGSCQASSGY